MLYLLAGCMALANPAATAVIVPPASAAIIPVKSVYERLASLRVKELQKMIGRRLTLKEKIGFWLVKKNIRSQLKKGVLNPSPFPLLQKVKLKKDPARAGETNSPGQTAFVFGLLAIGLLLVGLFVPYVIFGSLVSAILAIAIGTSAYKKDSSDSKAHMAKLIGWITLGVILAFIIAAAIIIASWSWW